MALPDIGKLHINGIRPSQNRDFIIPEDIINTKGDREMEKLKNLARLLPFSVESNSSMQKMLDLIILRICQAVEAQDYDIGLLQWDTMLTLSVLPYFCVARHTHDLFPVGFRSSIRSQRTSVSSLQSYTLSSASLLGCRCKW